MFTIISGDLTNLLRVEAGVGVVEDFDVEPAGLAEVLVAAGAPVLPLADLLAASLLPHLKSMTPNFWREIKF